MCLNLTHAIKYTLELRYFLMRIKIYGGGEERVKKDNEGGENRILIMGGGVEKWIVKKLGGCVV